ncbi:MAG: metallophosphoesterase family protein [Dehalococcoidia bacterium]|nr:metallophosphoesterase family protein [Dehalococcoidia bacterium]
MLYSKGMKYAILADIHANLTAFQVVLDDIIWRGGAEEIWCLGDIVGYGPDPHGCIELLRRHNHVCVAGNHDWAAIGKMDTSDFNPEAAAAARWTAGKLTPEDISYLESLPLTIEKPYFTLVHGSPRDPMWEYLFYADVAEQNLAHFKSRYCIVGHSHVPSLFECEKESCLAKKLLPDEEVVLGEKRLFINPGGVGQPRDGDPRASYALYDSDAGMITLHRVSYDIKATQARMAEHGLPGRLIDRLAYGF